jgi:hypothetical protein
MLLANICIGEVRGGKCVKFTAEICPNGQNATVWPYLSIRVMAWPFSPWYHPHAQIVPKTGGIAITLEESNMKKSVILASVFALATTSAFAGGFSQPMVEPMVEPMMPAEVVQQNSSSSSAGIVIPVLLVVALLVAAKNAGKI